MTFWAIAENAKNNNDMINKNLLVFMIKYAFARYLPLVGEPSKV